MNLEAFTMALASALADVGWCVCDDARNETPKSIEECRALHDAVILAFSATNGDAWKAQRIAQLKAELAQLEGGE